ncbi:hypothetical protein NQ036_03730 [Brevibacterium sp. 91QC2O2]|uniref:hypothetical protein n=1 Tax=Brevibacterium TaxID=1696 RepID=UPI00211D069F|nr:MULTISPECIES: hypothetical protein [unclassified Brevibacterium]MCQ9367357.1 hypothetical protein [Brevibacterium sp. 91QC2O2]MCQ9384630.1 hypothetical protein [Brevibacterium sp. 68QC2CO]
MSWARFGDTSANHPVVNRALALADADERIANELFGFVARCALESTAHNIEYKIPKGTALAFGGSPTRARLLIDAAIACGYWSVPADPEADYYELLQDDDFIHLVPYEEREWAKQQKRDRNKYQIVVPVRLRDGDGCRYCGRVVQWGSNNSAMAGTYDHLVPGVEAETISDLVVACQSCNGKFGDMPAEDKAIHLMPVPLSPYLSESTVTWLRGLKWVINNNVKIPSPSKRQSAPGAQVYLTKKTSAGSQPVKNAGGPQGIPTTVGGPAPAAAGPKGPHTRDDPAAAPTPGPRETAASQAAPDPAGVAQTAGPRVPDHQPGGRDDPAASTPGPQGIPTTVGGPAGAETSGPRETAASQAAPDPAEDKQALRQPLASAKPRERKTGLQGVSPGKTRAMPRPARSCPELPEGDSTSTGSCGSGRDGSGRALSGGDGAGTGREHDPASLRPAPAPGTKRKRRRR